MRFLSIYKTAEKFQPPSQDEIEKMSKLIEEMSKAGVLVQVCWSRPRAVYRARTARASG